MTSSSTTFEVDVKRNSLGLGFSIMGGPDAPHPYTNLIRIKKVYLFEFVKTFTFGSNFVAHVGIMMFVHFYFLAGGGRYNH